MDLTILQIARLKQKGYLEKNLFKFRSLHQMILELAIVISIICILIALAVEIFERYRKVAIVTHSLSSSYIKCKTDCMVFRALHGAWPQDTSEALSVGLHDNYEDDRSADYIKNVEIINGAMNIEFIAKEFKGKILTWRPAIPVEDPLGPVIWVGSDFFKKEAPHKWKLIGEDKTDISKQYIPKTFR